jgi:AsmA protein
VALETQEVVPDALAMSKTSRIVLFAAIGLIGLLFVVAAALLGLVNPNLYKTRLEASASRALGMEVSVAGRMAIDFFPRLLVTLEDVHFRNRAVEIVSAKEATIAIDLVSVLTKETRIENIVLKHPVIAIERDVNGRFNFERPQEAAETFPALDWPDVSVSDGSIVYVDKRFGTKFEGRDCHLEARRLRLSGGQHSSLAKGMSFTAQASCVEVRKDGFTVSDLKFSAEMNNGVLDLKPLTTRVFDTQGSGSVHADFSGAVPLYQVGYTLSQFPIEAFFKALSQKKVAAGRMDFSANLSTQGSTVKEIRQGMKGQVSLRGKNLTLSGSDLDREFERFESSQNFNLVDVGAFFFAGPLGLVVTKGYNFASIAQAQGGSSEIQTLVSDWKVERGLAHSQDVAMATKENRIALKGRLDFVNDQFDEVTMALVDSKGCVRVQQKISGTFQNPAVEKPDPVTSLAGPALRLLKKGGDILTGRQCDVFYAGSVAAPK